jgi:hypothetical protein
MPSRSFRLLCAAAAASLVLAACGAPSTTPPPEPERFTLAGTVANVDDVPVPINLTAFSFTPAALGGLAVEPAALDVYPPGFVALGTTILGLDGAFSIPLATGDELPDEALTDAADLVRYPLFGGAECVGTATADARVLPIAWAENLAAPYVLAGPVAGPSGTAPLGALFFGEGVPQSPPVDNALATWTFATAATRATGACSFQGTDYVTWDVTLAPGWNRVTVDAFADSTGHVSNRAMLNPRWRYWPAP